MAGGESDEEEPAPRSILKAAMHASPIAEETESQLSTQREAHDDEFYDVKDIHTHKQSS
jgi:hypothetical protein